MRNGLVSVVIPAYRQAEFLGEAVRSVLDQAHPGFEVIVVNDASPDETDAVVRQLAHDRLRCITHDRNLGLPAARNTGILASEGEFVAFLDADDLFHPDKVGAHLALFDAHPDAGASYNARFELNHSAKTTREIWRPPPTVGLADFVLGFPFSPSDLVVRRDWLMRVGLFDPAMGSAEDTDLPCRLALAGCRFARVDRALNSRRYHSGRGRRNLAGRRDDVARALDAVFSDPRCPEDVQALRGRAMSHHLMVLVSLALTQGETQAAHAFVEELIRIDPVVLEGRPCGLIEFLLMESVADEAEDHERLLQRSLAQMPDALRWLSGQLEWAVARGYLWKGLRAALWGRVADGRSWTDRAVSHRAVLDERFMQFVTSHLLDYAHEFGDEAAIDALDRVTSCVRRVGGRRGAGRLRGSFMVNRAFRAYRDGDLAKVPRLVARAIANDPAHLTNRGVAAIFARSLVGSGRTSNRDS